MTHIWAIADLHLCISCPEKNMEVFGPSWSRYIERIKENWKQVVSEDDLVLIAGDITWAIKPEDAKIDLDWIATLPGTKVMIRGNHDYWWRTKSQVDKILPPRFHIVHNDALNLPTLSIGGSRMWDSLEYRFADIVDFKDNPKANPKVKPLTDEENEKIFRKELIRLEMSLAKMDPNAPLKIAMTHYPPIGNDLKPSKVHALLKKYHIDLCVFGHLHNLRPNHPPLFGSLDNIQYLFTAADFLEFKPLKIK